VSGDCTGKVALVVGGTRGIGRGAALALAAAGATVVPTGRELAASEAVAREAEQLGAEAFPLVLDVTEPDDSRAAVEHVLRRFGRIDVLVANAGTNPYYKRAEDVTPEMWDALTAVNLRGLFFAVQAAARPMLAHGAGSIVVVSSIVAVRGMLRGVPYVATKGGLDALVRSLALEWADRGVRVNAVAPGYVATDLTAGLSRNKGLYAEALAQVPLGRFGEPEEVGSLIAFLASDAASYITGQSYLVDGGMSA
jgi:3-oxoacyl-[acyl-carrier protein] reductase